MTGRKWPLLQSPLLQRVAGGLESLLPTGSPRPAILPPGVQPKGNKLGEKSDCRHAGPEAVV